MINKLLIVAAFLFLWFLPVNSQVQKQETGLKRVVTLYNPYKPSLSDYTKKSFLPDMTDTLKTRRDFRYNVTAEPFMPVYNISPLKAAALLPDPLPKLYKSYINAGIGNYFTPLAEISICNNRSSKGTIGFYGRHFSENGNVTLQNGYKVYAGFMDNDVSVFGRKFFGKNIFESSVSYAGRTRHAYGYDTSFVNYSASKDETKMFYSNIGVNASLSSVNIDSVNISYHFDIRYNYFRGNSDLYEHNAGIEGKMGKKYRGFYVGAGLGYDFYRLPDNVLTTPEYVASLSPYISKNKGNWNFRVGLQAVIDKNMTSSVAFHIYPDLDLGFNVVPSYVGFFAGLSGKLERNNPFKIIYENPYLVQNTLYTLPNTDHAFVISAGLKGNDGIGGNYLVSASYSVINDLLLYSNLITPPAVVNPLVDNNSSLSNAFAQLPGRNAGKAITVADPLTTEVGNHFLAVTDKVDLFRIHGEMSGIISEKISYKWDANIYKYSLKENDHPWNKPSWDASLEFKYNLRNKILAGAGFTGIGKRWQQEVEQIPQQDVAAISHSFETPVHINLNLSAEYRYSKVLSLWTRINNISWNRYYEWAYYPSQGVLFMVGFSYSL